MQRYYSILLLLTVIFAYAGPSSAAEDKIPGQMTPDQLQAAGFKPLSEGDSLDAWNVKPWHKGHWTIKDGLINYDGKAKGKFGDNSLWTKDKYGDLQMYAEWRLPEKPKMKDTPIVL